MTTSLKDVDCAQMVNFLASVGGFDEEYDVYGFAFWQNQQAFYLVGEDYHQVQQQYLESIWLQQSATPIRQAVLMDSLLSGTKEDSIFKLKLKLAKQLHDLYPPVYFADQAAKQDNQSSNSAWDLLEQWRREIDGYFEMDDIQLFEEAVRVAYQNRVLDSNHCQHLRYWIKKVRLQMDDNVVLKDNFCRTFWGFFYLEDHVSRFICNASEEALYRQRAELTDKGILLLPVFSKTYWYQKSSDLSKQRQRFEREWQERAANCQFVPRICAILDLADQSALCDTKKVDNAPHDNK